MNRTPAKLSKKTKPTKRAVAKPARKLHTKKIKQTQRSLSVVQKIPQTATPSLTKSKTHFSTSTDSTEFKTFAEGPIITELIDNILVVKFNNPKMLNAMNIAMGEKMLEIAHQVTTDNRKNVKAVVLTGMGRGFSAGGDLEFLKARSLDTPENNITEMLKFYSRFMCIRKIPVPVIAAINGPAIGAGAAVASLADYRIASSNATIGWTFTDLCLYPGMGSTHFLPRITNNPSIASNLLLSGQIIDAGLAKGYGIVNEVIQIDEVDVEVNNKVIMENALNVAKHYTKNSSHTQSVLLTSLRQQQDIGLTESLTNEATFQADSYQSDDFRNKLDKMINRKKK